LPSGQNEPNDLYFNSKDNWVTAVDLYLSTSIEGVASPSVSLLGPFNPVKAVPPGGTTGTFTALFGASFDQTRTNLREYKLYIYMPELIKRWKPSYETEYASPNQGRTYLAGRLGLEEWLAPAVLTFDKYQALAPSPNGYNAVMGSVTGDTYIAKSRKAGSPQLTKAVAVRAKDEPDVDLSAAAVNQLIDYFAQGGSAGTGSGQSPTISTTITFTIKATGTLGPSFTISRVSGGGASLMTMSRTDNNYVNIVLTPATYCPTQIMSGTTPMCRPLSGGLVTEQAIRNARAQPSQADIQNAAARLDSALVNLNLAHILSP
jgi:hypothetical protein